MKYDMSQAELIEAVQFYMNEKILKRPVKVTSVSPQEKDRSMTRGYVLHVTVEDDQEHLPQAIKEQDRDAA